jgi:hypothetical protein
MVSGVLTTIDSAFSAVCAGEPLSVARTVKFEVPGVVGVPLMTPAGDNDIPAGSTPDPGTTIQVKDGVPPAAARVCE